MKLLVLLPTVPEPATSGARLRNLGLLRLLATEHEVHALAFGGPDDLDRLAVLVRHAEVVCPPPARRLPRRVLDIALSPRPDMAQRLWSPSFARQAQQALARERFDAVQAEGIEMARYLPVAASGGIRGRPRRIYDAHNAEFLLQRRAFQAALARRDRSALPAAAYSLVQWRRLERFEGDLVRESDLTLAVSYHDANMLAALAPGRGNVQIVPNGVDAARYPFREPAAGDPPNLLFVGKLDYRLNAEALSWLVRRVLPGLFARLPAARLFVVGEGAPAWLVAAGQRDDRIAVVGPVADERPYLARAAALVLPLHAGAGSRLKALVAMASGVPIVSTQLGMEGLEAVPAAHYLRADTPDEWAEAVARLLGDLALRRALAFQARDLVEQRYDWPRIAPALARAYATLGGG